MQIAATYETLIRAWNCSIFAFWDPVQSLTVSKHFENHPTFFAVLENSLLGIETVTHQTVQEWVKISKLNLTEFSVIPNFGSKPTVTQPLSPDT